MPVKEVTFSERMTRNKNKAYVISFHTGLVIPSRIDKWFVLPYFRTYYDRMEADIKINGASEIEVIKKGNYWEILNVRN
jgi:hypothetical protein